MGARLSGKPWHERVCSMFTTRTLPRCCREDKSPEFVRQWVQQHIDDAKVGGRAGIEPWNLNTHNARAHGMQPAVEHS